MCLLLACFRGTNGAARARRKLARQITSTGDAILDEVVLRVDARRRTRVYDPRRVLAGTLTSALTWGVFGLLTGGVASAGLWAFIGTVCGGLFVYYTEHLLTRDELKRIGTHLPGGSSAIAEFVRARDARRVLASAAASEPTGASVAAIGSDLSARVLAGSAMPVESSSVPASGGRVPGRSGSVLTMLLLRYRDERAARRELARHRPARHAQRQAVQTELNNGWEEPLAREPRGVYLHDDGRLLLGRKLQGKSQREMAMLGLTVSGSGRDGEQ